MAFRVGQKVVCINDQGTTCLNQKELCSGAIYTVRWIGSMSSVKWSANALRTDGLGIRLNEFVRGPCPTAGEADQPFSIRRFRPVVEKSTDIGMAILQEILDRETVKDDKPVKVRT